MDRYTSKNVWGCSIFVLHLCIVYDGYNVCDILPHVLCLTQLFFKEGSRNFGSLDIDCGFQTTYLRFSFNLPHVFFMAALLNNKVRLPTRENVIWRLCDPYSVLFIVSEHHAK
jgi:hypothetical protein